MKKSSKPGEEKYPKIYSIHSQKGGVGKTSVAIAIAGLEAIFNKKKVLLIDADLTGTSVRDVLSCKNREEKERFQYINELILAPPDRFQDYTTRKRNNSDGKLKPFFYESDIDNNIFFTPSSPLYNDISEVIPLISQEDYLHYFRHRFEDIIAAIFDYGFDVIIIDLPPGFHGLSKTICDLMFDQIINNLKAENQEPIDLTRLDRLVNNNRKSNNVTINSHPFFITSSDEVDYKSLFRLFSSYMMKGNRQEYFYWESHKERNKKFPYSKLIGVVEFIFNKMKPEEGKDAVDGPVAMGKILTNIKTLSNDGCNGNYPDIVNLITERTKQLGAISFENVFSFNMKEILETIANTSAEENKNPHSIPDGTMTKWCRNLKKILDKSSVIEDESFKIRQ